MIELRCENGILFGVIDDGSVEVKCRSSYCGSKPGVVVLHKFSTTTGQILSTRRYQDPAHKEGTSDGRRISAVRTP